MDSPALEGAIEISSDLNGVFIGGDSIGLRSLAALLNWMADIDQDSKESLPIGERTHVHLHGKKMPAEFRQLNEHSEDTVICRLDRKMGAIKGERESKGRSKGEGGK